MQVGQKDAGSMVTNATTPIFSSQKGQPPQQPMAFPRPSLNPDNSFQLETFGWAMDPGWF